MGKLIDLGGYRAVNVELKKYIDIIENKVDLNSGALLSHTHTKSQITDFPVVLKNPYSLILKLNGGATEGTNMITYDGGGTKTLNITAASIGAAAVSHNHNYLPLSGGTLTGNVTFNGDNQLRWDRNTDYFRLGFKNNSDSDSDSYGYIKIGDNGNEYFRIDSISGDDSVTIASFNREGIRLGIGKFIGNLTGVADKAKLLQPVSTSITTGASTWRGGITDGVVVWGQLFRDTSLSGDTGDLTLWLDKSGSSYSVLNMSIDGNFYASGDKPALHSGNYTTYTVTKTGGGASGTWGIGITGNAATATKATQDGSGNVITSKYITLDTAQTVSGIKTFSTEQRFNSVNAFRLIYNNYGLIFRNDGSDFYMLLTNSGEASTGNFNALRPFRIKLSTGEVGMSNGLISSGVSKFTNATEANSATTGSVVVSGGLGVAKQIVTNSKLYVGHETAANALIYLNGKKAIEGCDSWLRINDGQAFTNGIYCGHGILRTDGIFQVGSAGSSVNITTTTVQLKTPTTISNTTTITGVTSVTNTTASTSKTTGALKVSGGVGVAGKVNAASIGVNDTWTIQLGATGSIDFVLN